MFKEDVTQNIYSSWYENLKNKGKGSNLKPIRSLEAFSKEEINHLIWLLQERLRSMDLEMSMKADGHLV